jgi:hypothetical protein
MPSSIASSTTLTASSSRVILYRASSPLHSLPLDRTTTAMANHRRPAGARHPGRHQSEPPAGFNRNQVADINRNARPTSPESALWPTHKQIFDTIFAQVMILSSVLTTYDTGTSASISSIEDLLAVNLRKAIYAKPSREVEIQNAIETLLIGRGYQKGLHYDRETGRVMFSTREFIPDFVFKAISTVLEVKLIKEGESPNKVVEEMCADIPAYRSAYGNVLFCVYDLGAIRDIAGFQSDFNAEASVRICVVKH